MHLLLEPFFVITLRGSVLFSAACNLMDKSIRIYGHVLPREPSEQSHCKTPSMRALGTLQSSKCSFYHGMYYFICKTDTFARVHRGNECSTSHGRSAQYNKKKKSYPHVFLNPSWRKKLPMTWTFFKNRMYPKLSEAFARKGVVRVRGRSICSPRITAGTRAHKCFSEHLDTLCLFLAPEDTQ